MSPEAADSATTVATQTDVWSFAVVLFEALSGTRPFGHDKTNTIGVLMSVTAQNVPHVKDLNDRSSTYAFACNHAERIMPFAAFRTQWTHWFLTP